MQLNANFSGAHGCHKFYAALACGKDKPFRGGVMICPVCKLELGVERRADEVVRTYSFKDWEQRCRCRQRGDPVSCAILRPTILELLPEIKATPFRSETRATEEC
jgi:hypothetical protein